MALKRIGIIGAGTIGKAVFDYIHEFGVATVSYVLHAGDAGSDDASVAAVLTENAEQALTHEVDLVIEAANPDVLVALGSKILCRSDLCGFSISALANREVERLVEETTSKHGTRFFVPHGAILGLDGLFDAKSLIEDVVITTTKNGKSFGLAPDAEGIVFDGSARDACARFPRNVNVHAAVSLAGIGFDRTRSVVVADPSSRTMNHRVAISGKGLNWEFSISSMSLGGVTGSYTPHSAVGSLRRILGVSPIVNV